MVGWVGFEPTANWLRAKCSTPELPTRLVWWAGQELNLRQKRYERPALTTELPARTALQCKNLNKNHNPNHTNGVPKTSRAKKYVSLA